MSRREVRGGPTGPGDALPRMRLALSPRFDAAVIVLDDADLAGNLFPACSIEGCVRFLRTKQLCQTHLYRWKRLGQPGLNEFAALSGPATRPESLNLGALTERLRIELALAIQLLASSPRDRQRFRPQDPQSAQHPEATGGGVDTDRFRRSNHRTPGCPIGRTAGLSGNALRAGTFSGTAQRFVGI